MIVARKLAKWRPSIFRNGIIGSSKVKKNREKDEAACLAVCIKRLKQSNNPRQQLRT